MTSAKGAGLTISITQALSQFIFLVVVTNAYGFDTLGKISLINSVVIIGFVFVSFGLRTVSVVDGGRYTSTDFLHFRIVSSLLVLFLYIVVSYVLNFESYLSFMLFFYKLIEVLSEIHWAHLQATQKYLVLVVAQLARVVCSVLGFWVGASLGFDIYYSVLIYVSVAVVSFLIFESRFFLFNVLKTPDFQKIKGIYYDYFYVTFTLFLMSIQQNSLRILVGVQLGDVMLGKFAVVYQIYSVAYMIFMNASNFALSKGRRTISIMPGVIFSFVYSITALLGWLVLGEYILDYFFLESLKEEVRYTTLVLLFLIFRLLAYSLQNAVFQQGKFFEIFKLQSLLTVFVVLSSCSLIWFYGYVGAYYSLSLAGLIYLFFICFQYYFNVRR